MPILSTRTIGVLFSSIASLSALAAEPAPTTRPANASSLVATVASIKGIVQIRDSEESPWHTATVGMTVPIGGEVRTTPKAAISLVLPPDQIITVDRLTTLKILDAVKSDTGFHTDLGMKYGRVSYDVEAAGLEHEAIIRAPSSALAVRGTNVLITDDAFGSNIILCKGLADATNPEGSIRLQRNGSLSENPTTQPAVTFERLDPNTQINCVKIDERSLSVADYNFSITKDPTSRRTVFSSSETNVSSSMPVSFIGQTQPWQPGGSINTGGLGFENPTVGDGILGFTLVWFGDGSTVYNYNNANAARKRIYEGGYTITPDLDLSVISPTGQTYIPGAVEVKNGKVTISPNHHGGPSYAGGGAGGAESVIWSDSCPIGKYTYSVRYVGEGDPAQFTVQVTLNGKVISPEYNDTFLTELDPEVSFSIDVPPANDEQTLGAKSKTKTTKAAKPVKTTKAPVVKPKTKK